MVSAGFVMKAQAPPTFAHVCVCMYRHHHQRFVFAFLLHSQAIAELHASFPLHTYRIDFLSFPFISYSLKPIPSAPPHPCIFIAIFLGYIPTFLFLRIALCCCFLDQTSFSLWTTKQKLCPTIFDCVTNSDMLHSRFFQYPLPLHFLTRWFFWRVEGGRQDTFLVSS